MLGCGEVAMCPSNHHTPYSPPPGKLGGDIKRQAVVSNDGIRSGVACGMPDTGGGQAGTQKPAGPSPKAGSPPWPMMPDAGAASLVAYHHGHRSSAAPMGGAAGAAQHERQRPLKTYVSTPRPPHASYSRFHPTPPEMAGQPTLLPPSLPSAVPPTIWAMS